MKTDAIGRSHVSTNRLLAWSIGFGVVFFIALSMVAASGTPDPTEAQAPSMTTSIVNSAVIVFREGLEAVLIFAAVTASFLGSRQRFRRPVTLGVAGAFAATVLTWFVMQGVLGFFGAYGDVLLAVTGLIAVVVLLLVMNWFFHKVYWTDHIAGLNKKKRALVDESESGTGDMKFWGFAALGFTSVYREGFEVVLFLQNLQLKSGTTAVMWGVLLGLIGTAIVGWLTFVAHHKLPYKRMLVLTGVLLGAVLVVMVGGSARTMQDLGWISTTPLGVAFPEWWARWFEIVPTYETIALQLLAAIFVVGSYYAAEWWAKEKRRRIRADHARIEALASDARSANAGRPAIDRGPSPAQVRGAALAAQPQSAPATMCGTPATTLCGSDARQSKAAAVLASTGPIDPPVPTTVAPALVRESAWVQRPLSLSLPPLQILRTAAVTPSGPDRPRPAANRGLSPHSRPRIELRVPNFTSHEKERPRERQADTAKAPGHAALRDPRSSGAGARNLD